jgi:general secretion pathway protein G
MKWTERKHKGFTLVELLVVVGIIAMLATVLAPRMFKGLGQTKAKIARAKMTNIETAIVHFQVDCGRIPSDADGGLEALLVMPPDLEGKWNGPYCKQSDLVDPWDNPYQYVPEGQQNVGSFDLISLGADGAEGGDGDNADIVNL